MIKLSNTQQEIVEYNDGPIRIIAGPGSGKTRTVIAKIVHLVKNLNVNPRDILAITFTNKAA
jgi:DNA helicase-2/ATP-dependent DNA helicase PcrA